MNTRPLYVDLDQCLIRTDLLWEMAARLACSKPSLVPVFLWKCFGDRAHLKTWLTSQIQLPIEHLPWNKSVIDLICTHKAACGSVILATASPRSVAQSIATHLGFFDDLLATTEGCNLKGKAKLDAIHRHCCELGADSFAYIGDSIADIPIWQAAEEAWIVSRPMGGAQKTAHQAVKGLKEIPAVPRRNKPWLHLLRPSQWAKNFLLFLPLILAHRFREGELVYLATLATVAFSFTASAVYIFNDFADVFRDRAHPRKRKRPLASGDVPLWHAPLLSAGLLIAAGILAAFGENKAFAAILTLYLGSNLLYTFWIKHHPVVDVVGLALMYTLRIFAGGVATGLEVSKWLLTFSMFIFLSLAFGKRHQEIAPIATEEKARHGIRGYIPQDLPIIAMSGLASGFIAVLVLALYVQSPEVLKLYRTPDLLWLLCPLAIYWIGRFWILTGRGALHDDPVVFALKDRSSWVIGTLMLAVMAAAQL